jgi:hypothetical protein
MPRGKRKRTPDEVAAAVQQRIEAAWKILQPSPVELDTIPQSL